MSNRFEIKIGEFEEENIVDNLNSIVICDISDMCKKMNKLHEQNKELQEENEQLKAQLKDCEKRVTDKEVEWLRDNSVWEQMPTSKQIVTKTHLRPKRWKE